MKTTSTLPDSIPAFAAAGAPGGFYQRLVLQSLRRMTAGCLRLRLPDGMETVFGTPGSARAASIRVLNPDFFKRCVLFGDVGFGEAYVDGDWDTDDVTAVIAWFILNVENAPAMSGSRSKKFLINLLGLQNRVRHLFRSNRPGMSARNISEHYDLGNDFYQLFLDPGMTYSSALFETPGQTLEQAQTAKYDRLCRLLRLQPGEHVLEIGCGWGGFSIHAAEKYQVRVTGVTLSKEQLRHARERVLRKNLDGRIDLQLLDYRSISGRYDKIASIEMLEAVGDAYLETFFAKCHEVLKPSGLLGLQMITCPDSRYDELRRNVDWIQKHIFPGSLLLSIDRVNRALRNTGDLFLHDLKDLGLSYAQTLRLWRGAFNEKEKEVRALNFDTRFIRRWNYYLSYCEAAFAMRNISVVQAVYTRPNNSTLAPL